MAQPNFLMNQTIEFTHAGYTFVGRRTQVSPNIEPTQTIITQTFSETPTFDTTTSHSSHSILGTQKKKKREYRKFEKRSNVAMHSGPERVKIKRSKTVIFGQKLPKMGGGFRTNFSLRGVI